MGDLNVECRHDHQKLDDRNRWHTMTAVLEHCGLVFRPLAADSTRSSDNELIAHSMIDHIFVDDA